MVGGLLARIRRDPDPRRLARQGVKLGARVYLGRQVFIDTVHPNLVSIGDDTVIGMNTVILSHDNSMKMLVDHCAVGPVTIGCRVYLGANVTVLPGVTIGDGAIIGAGAVVTRDIPARSVATGNPAEVTGNAEDFANKHQDRFRREGSRGYIR